MRTITICDQEWMLRITPLPMRVNGEPLPYLVDFNDHTILASHYHGPEALADSIAKSVALIAKRIQAA